MLFVKALYEVKASGQQLSFNVFRLSSKPRRTIAQTVQMFRLLIERYAQFRFFRKGSGLVFPPHFEYDFSRKIYLISYSIN